MADPEQASPHSDSTPPSCLRCQQLDADQEPTASEHAEDCQYREVERAPAVPSGSTWECPRCEQIREGREPSAPDHSPKCSYRGTGKDPDRRTSAGA